MVHSSKTDFVYYNSVPGKSQIKVAVDVVSDEAFWFRDETILLYLHREEASSLIAL